MAILHSQKTEIYAQMFNDNLPNQFVGGFPAKFISSRISQNIFFHMIGNKSFHFIF